MPSLDYFKLMLRIEPWSIELFVNNKNHKLEICLKKWNVSVYSVWSVERIFEWASLELLIFGMGNRRSQQF